MRAMSGTGVGAYEQYRFLEEMRRYFSDGLYLEIRALLDSCRDFDRVEEIRLRRDKRTYLTVASEGRKRNLISDSVLRGDELSEIFGRMCDGSLYAYSESIVKGYISLPSGVRVGVCGHASVEGERVFGVYDISALNIRIPRSDIRLDPDLLALVRGSLRLGQGVLIFSPPAQGKTTCLRSIAYELALGSEPMRVSVVDSRAELSLMPENDRLSLDLLVGYPKAEGIRIATLFMNPEVIICDEIGSDEEARTIADAQNCGVPLIASAHASTIDSLMLKSGIRELHRSCAFGTYISLRIGLVGKYRYISYSREEAQRAFENNRCYDDNC